MKHETKSFEDLVGSEVEVLFQDQICVGPATLITVAEEGIAFTDGDTTTFKLWEEIVQISPVDEEIIPLDDETEAELAEGVVEMDSEP